MDNTNILEDSLKPSYFSGSIFFSTDYISKLQLVEACKKISENNPEFLQLRVRNSAGNEIAIDLLLDGEQLPENEIKGACVNYLRSIFQKYLNKDYLKSYSIGNMTVVVK